LLLGCYSNGTVLVWHASARKFIHRYEEIENPINCVDINKSGTKFVTGGNDENVKVYDLGKKSSPQIMESIAGIAPKHSNRVYCVKYNPENEN
jgi:COMPASS component SWD3